MDGISKVISGKLMRSGVNAASFTIYNTDVEGKQEQVDINEWLKDCEFPVLGSSVKITVTRVVG